MMLNKEHLNQMGLETIVALKANLNRGLSELQASCFSHSTPIPSPEYKFTYIPNPF